MASPPMSRDPLGRCGRRWRGCVRPRRGLELLPMHIANTQRGYGGPAILFHWLMAAMITVLVGLGLYMVALPDAGFDKRKVTLILVHKEIGVVVFAVAVLRL